MNFEGLKLTRVLIWPLKMPIYALKIDIIGMNLIGFDSLTWSDPESDLPSAK